jgi:hypothetical protein
VPNHLAALSGTMTIDGERVSWSAIGSATATTVKKLTPVNF